MHHKLEAFAASVNLTRVELFLSMRRPPLPIMYQRSYRLILHTSRSRRAIASAMNTKSATGEPFGFRRRELDVPKAYGARDR
mmetsp:Transcript_43794/g.72780  ORF Transcript_43794/g.72780 Transcript_43794/m.72780 type:complete len:82 (-) Transcript_43794:101-346(-)